jgi:hypothetical protein
MFYFSSMRNIGNVAGDIDLFLPNAGDYASEGGRGVVLRKTSPSGPGTTSCGTPKRRRGAQPGNRQALKTGRYTADKQALRKQITLFIRHALHIADMVEVKYGGKPRRRRKKAASG